VSEHHPLSTGLSYDFRSALNGYDDYDSNGDDRCGQRRGHDGIVAILTAVVTIAAAAAGKAATATTTMAHRGALQIGASWPNNS